MLPAAVQAQIKFLLIYADKMISPPKPPQKSIFNFPKAVYNWGRKRIQANQERRSRNGRPEH
jgi:hypothetical protein